MWQMQEIDPKYLDEHYNLFEHAGLAWPPDIKGHPNVLTAGMTERQVEVAIFLNQVFP